MAKNRKGSRGSARPGQRGSTVAGWTKTVSGTTRLVVPYMGVVLSTGSSAYQSQIQNLYGQGTSSVLYSIPIWGDYAAIFSSARVREVRVTYMPVYGANVTSGYGSGLAGFFQTNAPAAAPTSSMSAFREQCASARPFYVSRQYRASYRPGRNTMMALPFPTISTGTSPMGGAQWAYGFEGNPTSSGVVLGTLMFEYLLEFFRT